MNSTILAIGDKSEALEHEGAKMKNNIRNLNADYKDYLRQLLMINPIPKDMADGEYPIEWFGMETIRRENQPNLYKFYCFPAKKTHPTNTNLYFFNQTINAYALLREVRAILKNEHWLSKYVLTGPLKANLDGWGYSPEENYIRNAVYRAYQAESRRRWQAIFPYVLYLHRQHVKNK